MGKKNKKKCPVLISFYTDKSMLVFYMQVIQLKIDISVFKSSEQVLVIKPSIMTVKADKCKHFFKFVTQAIFAYALQFFLLLLLQMNLLITQQICIWYRTRIVMSSFFFIILYDIWCDHLKWLIGINFGKDFREGVWMPSKYNFFK